MIPVPPDYKSGVYVKPDLQSGEYVKPYLTTNLPIGGPIISSRKALPYVLKFQKET